MRGYGITRVSGRLVGDESFFDSKRTAPGWKSWFFINESPPLSALTADRGRYRGRTSRNPAQAAAELFREALLAAGVSVTGRTVVGKATEGSLPLASSSSLPLLHVLRFMNRESDNFTAEVLLKHLGTQLSDQGTTFAGAAVIRQILTEQQIPVGGVRIVDGSGLSRLNRLTPAMLVAMLQKGYADPLVREVLLSSLPLAGRTGTLRRRMRGSAGGWARQGQDRDDARGVGPVGLRQAAVRLRHPAERLARLDVLGAPGSGPVRGGPSHELASSDPVSERTGTPACWAFFSFDPGSSPTISPAVFFETELPTFAPFASSAAAASSRVNDSSVPVIT